MNIYVNRSGHTLCKVLNTMPGVRASVGTLEIREPPERNTALVGWGHRIYPYLAQMYPCLNANAPCYDKLDEIQRLAAAGVCVPEFRTTPPTNGRWHGRTAWHLEGRDFFEAPVNPLFWTKHAVTTEEFRVHVFNGCVLAVAHKIPKEGAHPWVRNNTTGWAFSYGAGPTWLRTNPVLGTESIKATLAVGYDFGAVDIALRADGTPLVFEINGAPGVESVGPYYAKAIVRWALSRGCSIDL